MDFNGFAKAEIFCVFSAVFRRRFSGDLRHISYNCCTSTMVYKISGRFVEEFGRFSKDLDDNITNLCNISDDFRRICRCFSGDLRESYEDFLYHLFFEWFSGGFRMVFFGEFLGRFTETAEKNTTSQEKRK